MQTCRGDLGPPRPPLPAAAPPTAAYRPCSLCAEACWCCCCRGRCCCLIWPWVPLLPAQHCLPTWRRLAACWGCMAAGCVRAVVMMEVLTSCMLCTQVWVRVASATAATDAIAAAVGATKRLHRRGRHHVHTCLSVLLQSSAQRSRHVTGQGKSGFNT